MRIAFVEESFLRLVINYPKINKEQGKYSFPGIHNRKLIIYLIFQ